MNPKQIIIIVVILVVAVGGVILTKKVLNPKITETKQVESIPVVQFPELPVYPGAVLEEMSEDGLQGKWISEVSVAETMQWYVAELTKAGWVVDAIDDPLAEGEQVTNISMGDLKGYVATEDEGGKKTEIVISLTRI